MLGAKVKHNMKDHFDLTYEELLEQRYIIVGSPETVIERLTEFTDDLGAGIVLGAGGHMGSMPHWQVMKCTADHGRGGDPALPRARRQAELRARGPAGRDDADRARGDGRAGRSCARWRDSTATVSWRRSSRTFRRSSKVPPNGSDPEGAREKTG